ncbi:arsinothricin resistance N-acetyltransferase ArsN1 family B [Haladaptatus sp. GCM10025707]|uniref:arsinothricin resistance N-acetyltransferase ArsN1 family B n=1 Tax=unclassified Haladaptatus TaxID=2622732 RepID=UPI0023E8F66F|nr:arsinothricin resistance N-acetyltransferase ArsN1 family B [Haladaptatus sp. QDMS2]
MAPTMHIRLATPADAPEVAAIYAPMVRETTVSFETDPPTETEMRVRIEKTLPGHPWLVCEGDGGTILGYAYAGTHNSREAYQWTVNVSVYIHEDARGQGLGRRLYETLFEILRLQGFYTAFAIITVPNDASVALHESLGFESVGVIESAGYKHGGWHDVSYWRRTLTVPLDDPTPPRSLDQLDSAVLDGILDTPTS